MIQNILTINEDFEDDTTAPWLSRNTRLITVQSNTGKKHIRFQAPVRGSETSYLAQRVTLVPNHAYKITFFAKSKSNTGKLRVSLVGSFDPGTLIPIKKIPSSYRRFTVIIPAFAIGEKTDFDLEFRIINSSTTSIILDLDTVSLTQL
ncbi:carbohydrate binding domain-containing protein [Paenibacillus sp. CGMCC 1.16610]|uniref:CBM-cenC domain-containing protein n=1 Tax=Paenibacillus anseongense TaxID=2682845 RepID=A0ABW9UNF2_9BACL|nr:MULTISPECIES: carbohydrate binding domain-containing protein [Paenibacillus]MBA2939775.1 carbohydrate binding domain-containing protein [Paenibacillus sp. CGMCC 1.16610]MVQ39435.1 hypothetical protein [Paenibacillus anseongense]